MDDRFYLTPPRPRDLTAAEELPLLRHAVQKSAADLGYTLRLARLLSALHRDGDVIELLASARFGREDEHEVQMLMGLSLLGRNLVGDANEARSILSRAVDSAPDSVTRACAYSELGKALVELRQFGPARRAFIAALADDPHTQYGISRLAALDLREQREGRLFELTEALVHREVLHSGVLAARYLALTALSEPKAAEEFAELESSLWRGVLPVPQGWQSLASFNAALADELLRHPGKKRPRAGSDSGARWRIDDLLLRRSQGVASLLNLLKQQIESQVAAIADRGCLWLRACPGKAGLHPWGMITHADAFDAWHMHVRGWLSGVYYVQVPDAAENGSGMEGSIQFGCPQIAGIDRTLTGPRLGIHPTAGQLLLFPSHFFHRTHATGSSRERISVAFDVTHNRLAANARSYG